MFNFILSLFGSDNVSVLSKHRKNTNTYKQKQISFHPLYETPIADLPKDIDLSDAEMMEDTGFFRYKFTFAWRNEIGLLHRKDGPAIIRYGNIYLFPELTQNFFEYYENGLRHRVDGPAKCIEGETFREFSRYDTPYYIKGEPIVDLKEYYQTALLEKKTPEQSVNLEVWRQEAEMVYGRSLT